LKLVERARFNYRCTINAFVSVWSAPRSNSYLRRLFEAFLWAHANKGYAVVHANMRGGTRWRTRWYTLAYIVIHTDIHSGAHWHTQWYIFRNIPRLPGTSFLENWRMSFLSWA